MRLALSIVFLASIARADPIDLLGYGPRGAAMGSAFTALSDDASAAMYNPAGSSLADRASVLLGYGAGRMALDLDGNDAGLTDPGGFSFAVGVPFRVLGAAMGAAIALYLPDQFVARLRVMPGDQPRFVLLDNDVDRIVFNPTLSLRLCRWLAIGGGVTLLANAAGNGITFDLESKGGQAQGASALDVELPTRAAPIAGVLVLPTERLRLGASWRGAIDLRLRIDVVSEADFGGIVEGDSIISVRAVNLYTPQRVSAGAAFAARESLTLTGDLTYLRWSDYEGDVVDLQTLVDLSTAPPLVLASVPRQRFRDVWVPRVGAEHLRRHSERLRSAWRAGAYYERSPVPDQTGLTSFADNDRVVATLGAGVTWGPGTILLAPTSLDATLQLHQLVPRETRKDDVAGPTGDFSSGGRIYHGSIMWTVRF